MYNYYNNLAYSSYDNNSVFKSNLSALKSVIDDGLQKNDINLSEDLFNIWLNYSQQIVNLVFENNSSVYANYINFCQSVATSRLRPYEKMTQVIKYLIELMRFI